MKYMDEREPEVSWNVVVDQKVNPLKYSALTHILDSNNHRNITYKLTYLPFS